MDTSTTHNRSAPGKVNRLRLGLAGRWRCCLALLIVSLISSPVPDFASPLPAQTQSPHIQISSNAGDGEGHPSYLPIIMHHSDSTAVNTPVSTPTPPIIPPPVTPVDPPAPYCIQGVVFYDANEDGVQNDPVDEPTLSGFQVQIFQDRNDNAELDPEDSPPVEVITTRGTAYRSGELEAGTYFVNCEAPVAEPPWVHTLPQGPVAIVLTGPGGDLCENASFGFKQPEPTNSVDIK